MNLSESYKKRLQELSNINNDDKIGKEYWFEYHCLESDASCDAKLWHHSHQKTQVLSISEPGY